MSTLVYFFKSKKIYRIKGIVILIVFSLVCFITNAQVPTNINSGNPNFPFPQFLTYTNKDQTLGNLGTQNAQGVPHAELELRISEAYRNLCNNIAYTGQIVSGVRYMMKIGNGTGFPTALPARGGDPCTCAEGDGYYLLAAAYMADKITFDGLYMQMHDRAIRRQKRFIDGVVNENNSGEVYSAGLSAAGEKFSPVTIGGGALAAFNGGSATDGDVDIALSLLVAAKQWGVNSGIILNGGGWTNYEISYVEEARKYISALADTIFATHKSGDLIHGRKYYNCGVIGLDGYFKDGEKQSDITGWFVNGVSNYKGIQYYDKVGAAGGMYADYTAPAYAKEWGDWFTAQGYSPWCRDQFYRAEAASDWLMKKLYDISPRHIPLGGHLTIDNANNVTYGEGGPAEDARHPWRNLLNYVWHGNPTKTWNPISHEVDINTANTYQRDMGLRMAQFLKNPQGGVWNNTCKPLGSSNTGFFGPPAISWDYLINGTDIGGSFTINWLQGSSSPAAIIGQDFDLMAEMYRQCEIEWDFKVSGDYLTGDPGYFHEWFRLLGMLVLSGNLQAPLKMNPASNLKVYRAIDKTFAFTGDIITDTISYRNYGKTTATGVKIVFQIPTDFEMVSASLPYTFSGTDVIFNIGTVTGFSTGNLNATRGQIILKYKVKPTASGRYCPVAHIDEGAKRHWTSNEYPNHVTAVMERNCVDIIKRSLLIDKTVNRNKFNPGDVATFTLDFENSIDAGWLDGGRTGITFSYAHSGTSSPSGQQNIKLRLWHDAHEPYIDYGNYRIAYYLNDNTFNCIAGTPGCTLGWSIAADIYEGGNPSTLKVLHEPVVPGTDAKGSWNQRVSVQFAPQLATTTPHLYNYSGMSTRIHRGGLMPLRVSLRLYTSTYANTDWFDDWSYAPNASDADGGKYHAITPDWTDINNPNQPVTTWHRKMCDKPTKSVDNILIEEWDGYVWRRAFGNGPVVGRDIENVTITDTLPAGLTFLGFVGAPPLGINPVYNPANRVISWTIPKLLAKQAGQIKYDTRVTMPSGNSCGTPDETILNKAWIFAPTESPLRSDTTITVTCNTLPPAIIPSDLIKRITSTGPYSTGATVTYELEYQNLTGSIAHPSLNSSANWTRQAGSTDFTFAATGVSTIQNQLGLMTYGYSHGTNGTINATVNVQTSAVFGFTFRHTGASGIGNGLYITFKPNTGAGTMDIKIWNGSTQLGTTQTIAIPTSTIINFQITLTGDRLDLWVNNFTGAPLKTFTGLPVRAGYAGFINGDPTGADSWGIHKLTDWNTHLDSGFNIQFYDPVPAGVTYVSSDNSGALSAGSVVWPVTNTTPTTPLLAGSPALKRSWTATINSCTNPIYNVGKLKIMGVSPDLEALATLNCDVITPLDFLSFIVVKNKELAVLEWETANEQNVKHFNILYSADGILWNKIGTIAGTNLAYNTYSFTTSIASIPIAYYKIQEVDNDGTSSYSEIRSLNTTAEILSFKVYPNPAKDNIFIETESSNYSESLDIEMINIKGEKIYEKKIAQYSPSIKLTIPNEIANGIYRISITSNEQRYSQLIVIQR